MIETLKANLETLKRENPLVLNITNMVVTNITANALLAIGASPVMAFEKDEIKDMTAISKSLVINIGTLTKEHVKAMYAAIEKANELSIPVILDPVGVGATPYRNKIAYEITNNFKLDAIRGNASEIANLAGSSIQTKGVDSSGNIDNIQELSKELANRLNCVVATSGKTDIITDSKTTYGVQNGDVMLTKITGSGCISTSIMGAFLASNRNHLNACLTAAVLVGISGEMAANKAKGLGSFQIEFFDNLSLFESEYFNKAKIEILENKKQAL